MNEIDLIKEVEKRPILYDKSVSGFNKTKLRDDAWKEVQEVLHVSEAECKKRWRSLRDSFIKLQRTHGGRTRWPYHYAMKFLLPHVEPKESASKREAEDSDPDLTLSSFTESKFEDEDEDTSQPSPKKFRTSSTDEENPCQQCNRTDPDELFLLSCASTLKRLNSKQNAVARLKIQQVLYEAEFGTQMELPCVTPASDCDFDNVDGTNGDE
ncbi:uncharacterized protein LOC113240060 isoform X2 [Hyposmocoma kahamanoa]|uniref:uncharacterized protein LOC113240060 isoform X2 n=1 Tax=Hyposmocoma kahamanoa TaxID=1477025 RepID=UPI000E6D935B|nr:uncharacterized protein LOC113240060 isoform X2 [Hyposmocoma kahamanoa]